jgi:LPXTG-site transpeptidase (sortase) family protein
VPHRAGTNRDAPETDTTRQPRAAAQIKAARRRRARRRAHRRAAALVFLVGALAALAAGVYLLNEPARGLSREAPPPAPRATGPVTKVAASPQPPKVIYGRPVRLMIPKIGLDAAVEYVGLTTGGAMAAPAAPDTVGWYEFGPRPGNVGSAVIDGHSGYADGTPASFDELPALVKGDRLYVKDASGRLASFVVRTTRLYARDANAAEVFASTAGRRLNLITCTGSFDVAAGTHSERLVVFAVLDVPAQSSHR